MAKYSDKFKYSIVKKMMPPENQSVSQIARETRVFDSCIKEKALGSPKRAYFFVKFTILLLSIFW
jgi:hypothetical protein